MTVVERASTSWREREVRAGEEVRLDAPALSFRVDELYEGIALGA